RNVEVRASGAFDAALKKEDEAKGEPRACVESTEEKCLHPVPGRAHRLCDAHARDYSASICGVERSDRLDFVELDPRGGVAAGSVTRTTYAMLGTFLPKPCRFRGDEHVAAG